MTRAPVPASVWIGHGQLPVADLEGATVFYGDVLGLAVTAYGLAVGLHAVFLAAGGRRDRTTVTTWRSRSGWHHVAVLYPSRQALSQVVERIIKHSCAIDDVRDHGVAVAVYLRDPEGNGVELCYERPRSESHDDEGRPVTRNDRIDARELLTEACAA